MVNLSNKYYVEIAFAEDYQYVKVHEIINHDFIFLYN